MLERRSTIGPAELVRFEFEGRPLNGYRGDSVAVALLANGVSVFRRSSVDQSFRAPFCMMGSCYECIVYIEGQGNRQACLTPLLPGMRINRI